MSPEFSYFNSLSTSAVGIKAVTGSGSVSPGAMKNPLRARSTDSRGRLSPHELFGTTPALQKGRGNRYNSLPSLYDLYTIAIACLIHQDQNPGTNRRRYRHLRQLLR